jgi:hypothetical protein
MESEMVRTHRFSITGAVIVCLVSSLGNGTLFASDEHPAGGPAPAAAPVSLMERSQLTFDADGLASNPSLGPLALDSHRTFDSGPAQSSAFAGQVYAGRPYRMNHDGSIAALMIGSVVAIAGAAVLIYANRPECDINRFAGGCGYGTKVVGGAVLSGGMVGIVVGALTWR